MEKIEITIVKKGKKDEEFNLLKWVLKAMSRDKSRSYGGRVLVTTNHVLATDGYRMHIARYKMPVQKGVYNVRVTSDVVALEKVEDVFPDVAKVFPRKGRWIKAYESSDTPGGSYTVTIRNMPPAYSINYKFFYDCVDEEGEWSVRVTNENDNSPIFIKSGRKSGVIAPFRL